NPLGFNELVQVQKYYIPSRLSLISSLKLFPDISPYGGDADPMVTPTLMYGRKYQQGTNVITAVAMTAFHILSVAAFFFIDAGAIATAVALYFVGGMLGIGMAYHRLLTHRSYKTTKWMEYFLTWCGTLALEGGPIFWVATHRVHHQKSDQEGDPH